MNRLFTFGCSLTNYHYPTWADIIATNFDEFQNWGRKGGGNNFILNSLIECHQRNTLGPADTVIILWSGISRIDYYQINEWSHLHNRYFDLKRRDVPFSCPDGYQLLSMAWVIAAINFLESRKVKWKMFHWQELDTDTKIYTLYKDALQPLMYAPFEENDQPYQLSQQSSVHAEDLYQRLAGPDWPDLASILDGSYKSKKLLPGIHDECVEFLNHMSRDNRILAKSFEEIDHHPSPLKHLAWVNQYCPEYTISGKTVQQLAAIDQYLLNQQPYDFVASCPRRF